MTTNLILKAVYEAGRKNECVYLDAKNVHFYHDSRHASEANGDARVIAPNGIAEGYYLALDSEIANDMKLDETMREIHGFTYEIEAIILRKDGSYLLLIGID